MSKHFFIDINNFSYPLDEEKIAKYPLSNRDESKLLIRKENGEISQNVFKNIANYIPNNSLLIYNNTRVIHARLNFKKKTGANIEIFCLSPVIPSAYESALSSTSLCSWKCMIGNLKKWKNEVLESELYIKNQSITLKAKKGDLFSSDNQVIDFEWNNSNITFAQILEEKGKIPIPPYLKRESESIDKQRYQTIYSEPNGSVAAPTAGLHFTKEVFNKLKSKNINTAEVTLHVGAGTFQPVKVKNAREHQMHGEQVIITRSFIRDLLVNPGKIVVIGTTTLRTLESIYWIGVKILQHKPANILQQWEWEQLEQTINLKSSLNAIINLMDNENISTLSFTTEIMIAPGYKFRITDALITNFHQPKSTLLLLIAAFIGDDWERVYEYALKNDFRFLSYGDSSFLMRK